VENYSFSDLITFSRTTNATLVDGTGNVTYAPNNLFTNSEAFENAAWVKGNSTVTANATVAPNGTTTADKSVENTATSTHQITQQTAFVSGTSYTWSFYVKAAERSAVRVLFPAAAFTSNLTANFDLATGAWITSSPAPSAGLTLASQDVGNGWYRISATATATASLNQTILLYLLNTPSGTGSYTGDGTSGIFIWGAQLEQVTYQTTAGTYNSTSPPNLLGFTEEFDNAAWTKTTSTIAANVITAPDGTLTADKHIPNAGATLGPGASATRVFQTPTLTSDVTYVFSIYAKAGEYDEIEFAVIVTPTATAKFSLTLGTVISGTGASITPVGNGWYRCAVSLTANATAAVQVRWSAESSTVSVGDGTSGIFVWGAQLSNSASVDPYVYNPGAAPTSTAYYGPRFDYNPTTLAPLGLLIEEQRVNLALYSEQLNDATWTKGNSTVAADAAASPDGTIDADKLIENTANAIHDVSQVAVVSAASGATYSLSVFLKAAERAFAFVGMSGAAMPVPFVSVDLTTGAVAVVNGTVASSSSTAFANGWWRVTVTATTTATGNVTPGVRVSADGVWANRIYTGDGTSGIFVWGAQVELGAFPTSYIPTVAATVTRAADIAVMSGSNLSSWYNQSQGTIVVSADSSRGGVGGAARTFVFNNGTSSNNIRNGGQSTLQVLDAGVAQVSIAGTPLIPFDGTVFKFASAYKENDFATVTTGAVVTDTSGTVPTVNQLLLGSGETSTTYLNGHLRSITYYPYRLADFQLQALTA
jgi:hypothetical protein